jgi:AbrB family looped-hinge helix DNA binding protein
MGFPAWTYESKRFRIYNSRRVGKLDSLIGGDVMGGPGAKHEPPLRFSVRAKVRPKAQLTLPEEIRREMRVGEGDEIEFAVHADGTITVRGYVSVPSDQAWFFTPEGLAGKRQASDEIAAGRGTVHASAEAMFIHLGTLGAAD